MAFWRLKVRLITTNRCLNRSNRNIEAHSVDFIELFLFLIFTKKWDQIKKESLQQSDIDLLEAFDNKIEATHSTPAFEKTDIEEIRNDIIALQRKITNSEIDSTVKKYVLTILTNVLCTLDNIDVFGIEGMWRDVAELQTAISRFERVFKSQDEAAYQAIKDSVSRITRVLEKVGAVYGGARALADLTVAAGYFLPPT